jgi:hypothetical protein
MAVHMTTLPHHRPLWLLVASLLLTACLPFRAPARPVGPAGPPTPAWPAVALSYAGTGVQGVPGLLAWQSPNSAGTSNLLGSTWPPRFPGTLTVPAGQSVEIVVASPPAPALILVAELDPAGVPVAAAAAAGPTDLAGFSYPLANPGRWILQVMLQWSPGNYAVFYFEVDVTP